MLGLVGSKVFADFPTLKVVVAHGGGAIPYQIGRFRSPGCGAGTRISSTSSVGCTSTPACTRRRGWNCCSRWSGATACSGRSGPGPAGSIRRPVGRSTTSDRWSRARHSVGRRPPSRVRGQRAPPRGALSPTTGGRLMAEIVIGLGTSHGSQVSLTDWWAKHGELDRKRTRYDELLAGDRRRRRGSRSRRSSASTRPCSGRSAVLERSWPTPRSTRDRGRRRPGRAVFTEGNMPAIAGVLGDTVLTCLATSPASRSRRQAMWPKHSPVETAYPIASDLGKHLVERAVEDPVRRRPDARPAGRDLDRRVLRPVAIDAGAGRPDGPGPVEHLLPSEPTARRCFAFGQAVRRAVESWPEVGRVAVVASGGSATSSWTRSSTRPSSRRSRPGTARPWVCPRRSSSPVVPRSRTGSSRPGDGAPRVRGGRLRARVPLARRDRLRDGLREMAVAVDVVERLRALDTCAVSDALDSLGLRGAVAGIVPVWPGGRVLAGSARWRCARLGDGEAAPPGSHLGAKTIDSAVPGT